MYIGVETHAITGGVDTHADVHVAAVLDPIGCQYLRIDHRKYAMPAHLWDSKTGHRLLTCRFACCVVA